MSTEESLVERLGLSLIWFLMTHGGLTMDSSGKSLVSVGEKTRVESKREPWERLNARWSYYYNMGGMELDQLYTGARPVPRSRAR